MWGKQKGTRMFFLELEMGSAQEEAPAFVLCFPVGEEPGQRVSDEHPEIPQSLSDDSQNESWLPSPGEGFPVALF